MMVMMISSTNVIAQSFEGTITLTETKRNTKLTKKIHVKGNMVKLETYLPNGELKGAKIINTETGKITAMIPKRKLYFEVPNKKHDMTVEAKVNKTGKTKEIAGKTAHQVIVKAPQANVVYWLVKGNFDFFAPMVTALAKNEKISKFFSKVEDKKGVMPVKSVEKNTDGTVLLTREVTTIESKTIDDSIFTVPSDYSLMEK